MYRYEKLCKYIYIYLSINQFYQLVRVKTELVNNSKALLASDSGKTLKFYKA